MRNAGWPLRHPLLRWNIFPNKADRLRSRRRSAPPTAPCERNLRWTICFAGKSRYDVVRHSRSFRHPKSGRYLLPRLARHLRAAESASAQRAGGGGSHGVLGSDGWPLARRITASFTIRRSSCMMPTSVFIVFLSLRRNLRHREGSPDGVPRLRAQIALTYAAVHGRVRCVIAWHDQ